MLFTVLNDCGDFKKGTTYTAEEFIETFGIEAYDDLRDIFCDSDLTERVQGVDLYWCGINFLIKYTIQGFRLDLGLSQKAFAERFNIPKRTIENWEEGKSSPPAYVMELLAYRVLNEKNTQGRA